MIAFWPESSDWLLVCLIHFDIVHVGLPVLDVSTMIRRHQPCITVTPHHCTHWGFMGLWEWTHFLRTMSNSTSKQGKVLPRKSLLNLSNLSHTILNTQIINCTMSACYRYCTFKMLFKGTNKEIYKQLIIARKWRNNVLYIYFKLRAHSFGTIPEWEYTELMVTVFFWDLFWFQNERNGAE